MPQSLSAVHIHLVFSTKEPFPFLRDPEGQETHHRKFDFQDELRKLLRRHQIDFDERYMWD